MTGQVAQERDPRPRLEVAGKRADRLIQGTAHLSSLSLHDAVRLLNEVSGAGATTFDLAQNYGMGKSEELFGQWLEQRGARDELFIITKGGHPYGGRNRITRADVREDLLGSLERLNCDSVDLYLLHRDDESVPVASVMELLHELRQEGLVRGYGVSNWHFERIEAANDYARAQAIAPLIASSPHFSLAAPEEEPWPGCVSIAGADAAAARDYYVRTGMPVLAWSSLAMGYFVTPEGDAPVAAGLDEAVHVFQTQANSDRRERARELATQLNLTTPQVALLYVLSHPMNVHPLVGCRSGAEYRQLAELADRRLPAETVRWLENG